nr:tail spike protein [Klebsiella phage vB_Ko_K5lambda5]
MNPQFSQPGGSVSKDVNKQSIARVFGVKMSEVAYLKAGLVVDSYKVLYDKTTQTCWDVQNSTGSVISWTTTPDTCVLVTSTGTFSLSLSYANPKLKEMVSHLIKLIGGVITPEEFYSEGETDHTNALKLAIQEGITTGKKVVFNPSIKYKVTSTINVTLTELQQLDIDFNNAIISFNGNVQPFIFQNTLVGGVVNTTIEEVSYNLSVTGTTNSRIHKLTAPGHSFTAVGQIGRIFSDDVVDDTDAANQYKAEYFVVAAIEGDVVYTSGLLFETYTNNIKICRPSNAKLKIGNYNFHSNWESSTNKSAMTVRGFVFANSYGVNYCEWLNGPCINVTACYMFEQTGSLTGYNLKNSSADGAFGYLFNDSGSFGTIINTIKSVNSRHPYTTSTGGAASGAIPGDGRWDLRGRTAFSDINMLIGQGDGCTLDSHATSYKININKVIALSDPRGDNVGGAAVQIRGNSLRIDSIEVQNCKTGLFVSGATKTSDSYISIGQIRVASGQGCLPLDLQGNGVNRVKIIIDNLDFNTTNDTVISVSNANVIVKYFSGDFNPYQNGGVLYNVKGTGVLDILDGDVYINTGSSHSLAVHSDSNTVIRAKLRATGMSRVSYLARSASQYDIQSEWDVHLDTWTGTPFSGIPASGAKVFAKIRSGATIKPLAYRALTNLLAGNNTIDLQNAGDPVLFLRIQTSVTGVVINGLSKGALPGQMLVVNNHTNSTDALTIASAGQMLATGVITTLSPGMGMSLIWDGSNWRIA